VIVYESLILMCHIPPFSLGCFSPRDDAWNIIGTLKLYLISELVKINHPLWKKRYDINAARIEARRQPYLIGSFFCLTESLSQLHPFFVFLCVVLVFLGMFIVWIYFMERAQKNFDILIMIDHVLSSFFSVPPANLKALQTMTGRNIKILTGLFSMCYTAVVGWTFGFRVAEHSQTVKDLTYDLDANLFYQPELYKEKAVTIQRWWRKWSKVMKAKRATISESYRRGKSRESRSRLSGDENNQANLLDIEQPQVS